MNNETFVRPPQPSHCTSNNGATQATFSLEELKSYVANTFDQLLVVKDARNTVVAIANVSRLREQLSQL